MSRRYLYNLFAQASTTPADFILSARLERCRDMLCDAAQAARQIGDIAFRYGFSDAARFSHAFRRRYGVSPSEYRRRAVETRRGAERAPWCCPPTARSGPFLALTRPRGFPL